MSSVLRTALPPPSRLARALSLAAAAPRRAPLLGVSASRFAEKRGRPHGAPFRQAKGALSAPRAVGALLSAAQLPPYARAGGSVPRGYPPPAQHVGAGADAMRRAGALAAEVLARAGERVVPGASLDEIDAFVHALTLRLGAYPSPLGYMGFPKSVCASVNEVVCHGIPDDTRIERGDIVKLDVSVFVGGVHGDTCRTFVAGDPPGGGPAAPAAFAASAAPAAPGASSSASSRALFADDAVLDGAGRHLVAVTKRALDSAVALCGPGVPIGAVGRCIGAQLERERLEGVEAFAGHGVGAALHTEPIVHHHENDSRFVMRPGMAFTIEPMVVEGSNEIELWPDGWAVVTRDLGRAAQFEHTLLVTEHGVEVLTRYEF